jgi:hypothetical protein
MPDLSLEFWIATGIAVLCLLVGVGATIAVDAKTRGEFYFVVVCFATSAIVILYGIVRWALAVGWQSHYRVIAVGVLFAVTGILTYEAVVWSRDRHEKASTPEVLLPTGVEKALSTPQLTPEPQVQPQLNEPPKAPTRRHHVPENVAPKSPEIGLRFIYPEEPSLVIDNLSELTAKDIKWAVVLWNMDLPDRNDPLPIPVSTFDWIKGHSSGGPQNLFSTPLIAPLLHEGNRLFGSATVDCPECGVGRTYAVYIVWKSGGWFSEIDKRPAAQLFIPSNFLRETREAYFKQLDAMVPPDRRAPILKP